MLKLKQYGTAVMVAMLSVLAVPAMAAGTTDYSGITGAVDWSAVITAVIAVFALGAAVTVAFVGGKLLLRSIKGAV